MDTPERPDGALSPWTPPASIRPAAPPSWGEAPPEDGAPPPKAVGPKVIFRALRRHWWQVLAVWFVGSSALMYLAYTRIKPTYDAMAWLDVEPPSRKLLADSTIGDMASYMDTQVLLVTSPEVLDLALTDRDVAVLPRVVNSPDPEAELRKEIGVTIPKVGAHVIQVKMTGEDAKEVAAIVNGVTKSYLEKSRQWAGEDIGMQIDGLRTMEKDFEALVKGKREEVRAKAKQANVNAAGVVAKDKDKGGEKEGADASRQSLTAEQYRELRKEVSRARVDRLKAEAAVREYEAALGERKARALAPAAATSEAQVEAEIEEEFKALPQVAEIKRLMATAEGKQEEANRRIRRTNDPTLKRITGQFADLKDEHDELWRAMYPVLRRRILRAASGNGDPADARMDLLADQVRQARLGLQQARLHEAEALKQLEGAEVEYRTANHEALDFEFAREDLRRDEEALATIQSAIKQLQYEGRSNAQRIKRRAEAKAMRSPSSNNRNKVMAGAPVLMLLATCALFVLLETRSGRVADPDELSQRVRLGVIGVVPPLPSPSVPGRTLSIRGQRDEKRRLEEFMQSLDHLRVTLCADRPGLGRRRCVLITSATGGEGKTTLAAQLAGRCANAGLMTLLIDADLRRPSLGDLLEVPEGPGLVDVLAGDATPEAAMVVIGNAGGFHLLPAGTLGQDPSRLLHGDRLGQVIHQFRETFDMVIIDAPPVLAVPDALLLGRWTDGAVLAVRHDASRFPLVERANKRLASVGVCVLGAVVNGCRTMESSYGSYRYTPYAAAEAPGAAGAGDLEV